MKLRHKFDKAHIIFDTLFRLINFNIIVKSIENELNALFTIAVINLNKIFRKKKNINKYITDLNWKKILQILNFNDFINIENSVKLLFYKENNFIFRFDNHVYEFHRLCISWSTIKNILKIVYNETHFEFAQWLSFFIIYVILSNIYVIILNII